MIGIKLRERFALDNNIGTYINVNERWEKWAAQALEVLEVLEVKVGIARRRPSRRCAAAGRPALAQYAM
jgi:hypothetical protein